MKIATHRPKDPDVWRFCFRWGYKMCEAKIYITKNGDEERIMEDVVLVQPEGDAYLLVSLLGEQKLVKGTIKKIDFLKHTVHLNQRPEANPES